MEPFLRLVQIRNFILRDVFSEKSLTSKYLIRAYHLLHRIFSMSIASRQLEFVFDAPAQPLILSKQVGPQPVPASDSAKRERMLNDLARRLMMSLDLPALARQVVVRWNPRMRSTAGRAHFNTQLVELNPRLLGLGNAESEIDRTLRHELAHLVAYARSGRAGIREPHGPAWRQACADLGIADERRCHTLPLPVRRQERKFLYACVSCGSEVPRVRRFTSRVACYACCQAYNGGEYDERYRLVLATRVPGCQ